MRGCVLAGGRGRRLGGGKPAALLAGRPLVAYPLAALREAGLDPVIVAKRDTPLPAVAEPVVNDHSEATHPLAGIVTALRELEAPVLVCAADMPFVTAAAARLVAAQDAPVAVPEAGGRLQPLFARYAPAALAPLERGLAAQRPLSAVVEELRPRVIAAAELRALGDPAHLLANVNTPAELAAAEERLRSGAA